ncbi:hypothetical protein DL93DRAFT_2092337, partial [Clavulina sp. PMI_390]
PKTMKAAAAESSKSASGPWGPRQPEVIEAENGSSSPKSRPSQALSVDDTVCCYNCNTTATPLWRKDDNGRTLCNACGL